MKKIALLITYLYMLCCPLEFVLNVFFGSSVKIIALVAVIAIVVYFIAESKNVIKFSAIQFCLIGWATLETVSVLWTTHTEVTYTRLMTYLMMAAFVVLLSFFPFSEKEADRLIMFYSLGGLILALLVLGMGEMDGGVNSTGRLTVSILGRYQDPNGLAANILGGAFYSLHKVFEKKKIWFLYAAAFLIQSAAIFFSGSRGGLVAYLVALVLYALIRIPRKGRIWALLGASAGVVCGYFLLEAILPETLFNRLFDVSNYFSCGGTGRIATWKLAISEILRNPLFGSGIASYLPFFLYEKGSATAMHNTFLCVAFEVGLVGLAMFMAPYLKIVKRALDKKNALIIAMIVCNLTAAFFLDALYLRYTWNAMVFGIVFVNLTDGDKTAMPLGSKK